jgi:hypothetical protein
VSPILVRPVREQLEHDRVIRLLQVKLKRRHDVTANIGEEQTTPVKIGLLQIFPDLVLTSTDRGRKLMGTVEVETSESVNHLEARAQWAHLGRARAPFHLYVPAGSVEIARRLAAENQVNVSEIWSYHTIVDQTRFTLVYRAPETRRASGDGARTVERPATSRPATAASPPRTEASARPTTASPSRATAASATRTTPTKKRATAPRAVKDVKQRAALRTRRTASRSSRSPARTASRKSAASQPKSAQQKRK